LGPDGRAVRQACPGTSVQLAKLLLAGPKQATGHSSKKAGAVQKKRSVELYWVVMSSHASLDCRFYPFLPWLNVGNRSRLHLLLWPPKLAPAMSPQTARPLPANRRRNPRRLWGLAGLPAKSMCKGKSGTLGSPPLSFSESPMATRQLGEWRSPRGQHPGLPPRQRPSPLRPPASLLPRLCPRPRSPRCSRNHHLLLSHAYCNAALKGKDAMAVLP
jgi:hypothetical protein